MQLRIPVLLAAAFAASSCIHDDDNAGPYATIQAFFIGSNPTYVGLTISSEKLQCYPGPLQKPARKASTPEIVLIQLDTSIASLDDLELGTRNGLYANTSANSLETTERANLTLSAITETTVKGSYQLTDTLGVALGSARSFSANKCPDYDLSQ
ncbi:MAG: hypothetical protein K0Q91_71 [Fibrobacteria bacterium]|jgi:hypothetical protein|nr:hypothetical protein [Fibrobacteria bacterium]